MSTVDGKANGARRNGARDDKVRVAIVGVALSGGGRGARDMDDGDDMGMR